MRGYYKGYEAKCIMKWGMDQTKVIGWKNWHAACVEFWNNILTIDDKKSFMCVDCGPRPEVLVIDGIGMGMTTNTPCQSNKTFQGSKFEDQMFISKPANRKILK